MNQPLELRILSGMHQDARCMVRHDALIGAHPECDIVLADAALPAQAARLKLGPDGWGLVSEPQEPTDTSESSTPYNQPLPLGSVWITVAHPTDPWLPPTLPADDETSDPDPMLADMLSAPPDPTGALPRSDSDAAAKQDQDASPPVVATARRRSRSWVIRSSLIVLVLAIAVALLMAALLTRTPLPPPSQTDPRLAAEQSIGKITAAIEQLGLASRIHVTMTPEGVAQVSGWVRNEEERDQLASALAQIWPMPAMQVSNEAEVLSTADRTLKGFGVVYEARYEGDGRLAVAGIATDPATRSMAIEAVRAQLPGMAIMGNGIQLAPDVAKELSRELATAGLGAMTLVWQQHQLEVDSDTLDADQMAMAQTILDRFNQTHFGVASLLQSSRPYADAVPFKIRSVISGKTPYIVLDNGTKLLVGGTHQHYRLTRIDEHQLVFEGPRPAIILR